MLNPVGLTRAHYECRSLDETLPVFTDLLAMTVIERRSGEAVLEHPNTPWKLVVHESGPEAPDKPRNNHYGFRVAGAHEIAAAWTYIEAHKERYRISRVTKPHTTHFATSVYFNEPGGNTVEIEYYDPQAAAEGRTTAAPHWDRVLPEREFPGRGYVPQALTHGTLECDDKDASARFYRDVLGLQLAGGGRISVYIKHPSTPWYIVVLPSRRRRALTPLNRFTLSVAGPADVEAAHREFAAMGRASGISELQEVRQGDGEVSFTFSDLDRNWWEVAAAAA
ncbi:MAG TPA: VOC family protein [Burkholderiales bacterium]|nr:VOC family protein [Burkholderiales bacterium]